jgi:hypothetical protein
MEFLGWLFGWYVRYAAVVFGLGALVGLTLGVRYVLSRWRNQTPFLTLGRRQRKR